MKLTKDQRARLDAADAALSTAHADMCEAVGEYNGAVQEAVGKLNEQKRKHDDACGAMNDVAREVAEELREAMSERSEKWQESEAGESAEALASALEELHVEAYEPSDPDELDEPEGPGETALEAVNEAET